MIAKRPLGALCVNHSLKMCSLTNDTLMVTREHMLSTMQLKKMWNSLRRSCNEDLNTICERCVKSTENLLWCWIFRSIFLLTFMNCSYIWTGLNLLETDAAEYLKGSFDLLIQQNSPILDASLDGAEDWCLRIVKYYCSTIKLTCLSTKSEESAPMNFSAHHGMGFTLAGL